MKVLIIGSGGREHAIAAALAKSPRVTELHCTPGNGGVAEIASCHTITATDIDGVLELAMRIEPDWVVVAPDDPLVMGMVDALNGAGFRTFGPRKAAARLEGSKAFSKEFMKRHNIPTAAHETFDNADKAVAYIKNKNTYPAVIKCDGLALGKGVIIAQDEQEAIEAIAAMFKGKFGDAGKQVVIEEFLQGKEVTVLAFTDGKSVIPMPPSTDHKRALDGDKGLNTGGMGVVAGALPYWNDEIAAECMKNIFMPTIEGMASEGCAFKGCLYFGLMLTENGVKVIEYNCRFGDPEAQAILPLLETDLMDIIEAVWQERLSEFEVRFSDKSSACVVMASGGYPEHYTVGYEIIGVHRAQSLNEVTVYHAGTKTNGLALMTTGGRVLGVTAVAEDLTSAVAKAYYGVRLITFRNAHFRNDIGAAAIGNT